MRLRICSLLSTTLLILLSNTASAVDCDPINTYCQSKTLSVCEKQADITQSVADYVCIWVPDPKWYNPANLKKKCLTNYVDKIIPGTSSCSTVLSLGCPSVTSNPSLSCNTLMYDVKKCMDGDSNTCAAVITSTAFAPACTTYSIYQNQILETSYETRLYDLVDTSLYSDIQSIFGDLLGDNSFDDYVRGTVEFYKTSTSTLNNTGVNENGALGKTIQGKTFFNVVNPSRDLIIHELTHQWQIRNRLLQNVTNAVCIDFIKTNGHLSSTYTFNLEFNKSFADYGVEQQAQIIQDYYLYKSGPQECDKNFLNCSSFASDYARLNALKAAITSSYTSLTPTTPPPIIPSESACKWVYQTSASAGPGTSVTVYIPEGPCLNSQKLVFSGNNSHTEYH